MAKNSTVPDNQLSFGGEVLGEICTEGKKPSAKVVDNSPSAKFKRQVQHQIDLYNLWAAQNFTGDIIEERELPKKKQNMIDANGNRITTEKKSARVWWYSAKDSNGVASWALAVKYGVSSLKLNDSGSSSILCGRQSADILVKLELLLKFADNKDFIEKVLTPAEENAPKRGQSIENDPSLEM